MTTTTRRRRHRLTYGSVTKLPSGRYRARYTGPDGTRRSGPDLFPTRKAAEDWLAGQRSDNVRGTWRAPELGAELLADYARGWLASRSDLAPRTLALYADLLDRFIDADIPRLAPRGGRPGPAINLAAWEVRAITPAAVREWTAAVAAAARSSAQARQSGPVGRAVHPARAWAAAAGRTVPATGRLSPALLVEWEAAGRPDLRAHKAADPAAGRTRAAHAYRLVRTILAAAVRDGLIPANPCQTPRAAAVRPAERKPATPAEIDAIAAAMPARHAAAVVVAAWSGLRAGELFALARRHVDTAAGAIRVERALVELPGQPVTFGPPKSDAGRRTVHLPAFAMHALAEHLEAHVPDRPDALVFPAADGKPLRSSPRTVMFHRARAAAGRPDLRWHDLRHTGATLAAQTGATLRSLQRRMGHSTVRAALIYQHATDADDALIAARLDAQRAGTLTALHGRLPA